MVHCTVCVCACTPTPAVTVVLLLAILIVHAHGFLAGQKLAMILRVCAISAIYQKVNIRIMRNIIIIYIYILNYACVVLKDWYINVLMRACYVCMYNEEEVSM